MSETAKGVGVYLLMVPDLVVHLFVCIRAFILYVFGYVDGWISRDE